MKIDSFPVRADYDLICFSHLRWDFVYQRPQHLLSRFAKDRRVFFIEEPLFHEHRSTLDISSREDGLVVVKPYLEHGADVDITMTGLLDRLISENNITDYVSWYYTPMMTAVECSLKPEGGCFRRDGRVVGIQECYRRNSCREEELFGIADLVFTGGRSLYESKKNQQHSVHCFPSSIDVKHFARALDDPADPADQAGIPEPRIGFFGVIDERTDIELLGRSRRP